MSDLFLPRLRPDQWAIAEHPARVKVIAMGRRWGKTTMAGSIGLAVANAGGRAAWIAPTYRNSRPLWRWAEETVGPLLPARLVDVSRAERVITFPRSAGFLGVYSGDNDVTMRGESFDLAILDEASRLHEETWTEVVQPTLADREGSALLPSTPFGMNWFWREWEAARARMDGELAAFRAPSWDNPLPAIRRAAELARERVPERVYRQEWLAEFLEGTGIVFRRVREASTATPQAARLEGHRYCIGVDWGKLLDYTVMAVVDTSTRELVALDRSNRVDYALQAGRLRALAERFRPDTIIAEQNSMGEPIVEHLQRLGLPVQPFLTTNASKAAVVDALALAFEQEQLRVLPDEVLLGELLAYQAERLPSGLLRYGAPEGSHDDCVTALALAWSGASVQPTRFF
jgi:hypothetical protein